MDINTQNSSGMMNGMPPTINEEKKIGPIIGTLIIVILIIIAALYFFGKRLDNNQLIPNTDNTTSLPPRNDSVDINNTDTIKADEANLDAELDNQLKDIDASF